MTDASTLRTLRNRIGNRDLPASDGSTLEVFSPGGGGVSCVIPRSTDADVHAAAEAAHAAFAAWSETPAPVRGELLFRAAALLTERKDAIAAVMSREMGKRVEEAKGDIQEAIDTAFYAGSEGRRLFGHTAPSELRNKLGLTLRRPLGVAGIITAWNFPIAVPSWKILPALVCGNTLVWKPAEEAPESGHMFAECLWDAGIPTGVLNVVHGRGEEVGKAIVRHPRINALAFTGSTAVGREIAEVGGRMLKRVSLELGGKNPVIVLPDADIDLAVDGILWGAFGTAGQRCTATSRCICVGGVEKALLPKLLARAAALSVGDPADPTTEVGPLITAKHRASVQAFVDQAVAEGGVVRCGGAIPSGPGNYYPPTVVDGVKRGSTLALQEVFGPVLAMMSASSLDEAISIANEVEYGLSSSIYTRDINAAFRAVDRIEAGITYVNAPTIGAEAHFPFGGVKATGNGHREGGWMPYEFFTEVKTVYVDFSGALQRAQIDNRDD